MMSDIFPAGVQAAGNNTFVWSKVAPAPSVTSARDRAMASCASSVSTTRVRVAPSPTLIFSATFDT